MKTSAQKRLARLSGLVVLSFLVVALVVQAAQAAQLPTAAQIRQHKGVGASAGTLYAAQLPTAAQTRQHKGVGAAQPPASSGTSSPTVWMAAAAVFGALLIGSWALAVRRRGQSEAAPGCEASVLGC
jgi:hypothetical protein